MSRSSDRSRIYRVTAKTLHEMAETINQKQGPGPQQYWRLETEGERIGRWMTYAGHIGVSSSTGAGSGLYTVCRWDPDGDEHAISPTMTAQEAWHYLTGVLDALEGRYTRKEG